ncbi:AzlD domain-containing protein [Clostridium vitabionis]|jgi:branched-subunit amino acid transport protein|uniref:AzlD domain-containing protein n=1 Tax=Clostridium vitabionis TaxID=2784388 RepID=UPI00188C6D52|nr:AzlD domain-containing protein [Clostridium vitabionis]
MNAWRYILVMAAVTYAVRVLPLTLIRRPVTNRFLKSFLYYVPYVTLAVMTFPAILHASGSVTAGFLAFAVGILFCWKNAGLFPTSIACCVAVLAAQLLHL